MSVDFIDFRDIEGLRLQIVELLTKSGYQYSDENPNEDELNFFFDLREVMDQLGVFIAQNKSLPYQIDIVSQVKISPEHQEVLRVIGKESIDRMASEIIRWTLPREPDFQLILNENNDFSEAKYFVISSIFEGELTFPIFMQKIKRTLKSSLLVKIIIQSHLNPLRILEETNIESNS